MADTERVQGGKAGRDTATEPGDLRWRLTLRPCEGAYAVAQLDDEKRSIGAGRRMRPFTGAENPHHIRVTDAIEQGELASEVRQLPREVRRCGRASSATGRLPSQVSCASRTTAMPPRPSSRITR